VPGAGLSPRPVAATRTVSPVLDRLSDAAHRVVAGADAAARELGHDRVGTEHLLLSLLADEGGVAGAALRHAGATLVPARHKVAEAVAPGSGIGSGSGAGGELPRTPRAERALDRAARFARQERAPLAEPEHVLLGILDVEGLGCQVLRGLGVDVTHLRHDVVGARSSPPAASSQPAEVDGMPLRCPGCRQPLEEPLPARIVLAGAAGEDERRVLVPHCGSCGVALGVLPA